MALNISKRFVGDVLVLDLNGRIILGEEVVLLRDTIRKLVAEGKKNILLNIADVTYIDSSGIMELVSAFMAPRNAGGTLKLLSPTKKVQDLLQLTKLYTVFDVFSDEKNGIESFHRPMLHCCCPVCGQPSGPPLASGERIWSAQVCRNERCKATFNVCSSPVSAVGLIAIKSIRIQTYADAYFELLSGPPFTVKIVGPLDLFSAPGLEKSWQVLPRPCKVLFDLSKTTVIDDAGTEAVVTLLKNRDEDAMVAVSLQDLGPEQVKMLPVDPPFYRDKSTALAALGDVSNTASLQAKVMINAPSE
jgi:anti-sigma B factor antagonist